MKFILKDFDSNCVRWVEKNKERGSSTLYIHTWRVPANIPEHIELNVLINTPNSGDSTLHDQNAYRNGSSRHESICREAYLLKTCKDTYRYELIAKPGEREIPLPSVYIPKNLLPVPLNRVYIQILWQ